MVTSIRGITPKTKYFQDNWLSVKNQNLHASNDEAKTAKSGEKGVTIFTTAGNALCIYAPNRIGATTT